MAKIDDLNAAVAGLATAAQNAEQAIATELAAIQTAAAADDTPAIEAAVANINSITAGLTSAVASVAAPAAPAPAAAPAAATPAADPAAAPAPSSPPPAAPAS